MNVRKPPRNEYKFNPLCICEVCLARGVIPVDHPESGHSLSYGQPHIPPR